MCIRDRDRRVHGQSLSNLISLVTPAEGLLRYTQKMNSKPFIRNHRSLCSIHCRMSFERQWYMTNDDISTVTGHKRSDSLQTDNNHTMPSHSLDSIFVSALCVIDVRKKLPPETATDGGGLCYKV